MDIYTLDGGLVRAELVENYKSAIWTERYTKPGDVELKVKATPGNMELLAIGTVLATPDSEEGMLIETQEIEDGMLLVKGPSLLQILQERILRYFDSGLVRSWNFLNLRSGQMIYSIVNTMVVTPGSGLVYPTGLDLANEVIPNLEMGYVDLTGAVLPATSVPFGPVLEAITTLAEKDKMGLRVYLDPEVDGQMLFNCYRGVIRTRASTGTPTVQFSPVLDNLTGVKELHSVEGHKNVAYVFRTNWISGEEAPVAISNLPVIVYAPDATTGIGRRVMMVEVDDLDPEQIPSLTQAQHNAILWQRGYDALMNAQFTRLVEGEVTPQSKYKFGVDYQMGDIVELVGHSGFVQDARVVEYIRSQDDTGFREYPTVSVEDV